MSFLALSLPSDFNLSMGPSVYSVETPGWEALIKNPAASGRGMPKEAAPKSKSQFAEESAPNSERPLVEPYICAASGGESDPYEIEVTVISFGVGIV